ncbi:PD-(D/E)XK nuclease family protein [Fluoribacter gormanii]|uniref:PD-(D/E)XK nuclease family protein n=1 Tax=Fluoribacter gormanii TaxID=464 RepID=UPI0022445820|nr:PD-(D/E)XK nuclease family protein [Fluoribacter gormanii]MCW8471290.1 PD-(D/E)XK nuclease family protein [Fluoribacter gormanii]
MPTFTFTDKEHLFLRLAQKNTVLTPNNRLSEAILQQYFAQCKKQTVEKPQCMPFSVALVKAYEQLNCLNPHSPNPTLLNRTQCQYLWRKIIQSESNITYSEGLLKSIISAWERCQLWQISMKDPAFHYTEQTQQFQKWWQLFDKQLNRQHLITEYQLIPYLLNANSSFFSQDIVWVCFDDFTPQQILLQEHLAKKGFAQYQYDLEEKVSNTKVFAAEDSKEEYQQLMLWLHSKIQEGNQRIGVVVPNLEQESPSLQRMLAHHFESSYFNISLGQSLSNFPLVAHALCWLGLDATHLSSHQASLLLQSPYLSSSKEEFIARSEYLQDGVLLENHSIRLSTLIKELQHYAPKLANLLDNLTPYPREATVQEWIHLFQERLNTLGFPGDYTLSSENYQCFNRFLTVFDELRQFALLKSSFTKSEAFEAIRNITDNTIFQAQKTNAPIQISGLLEASGCEFDSLWIMGLTDQCLPQKVQLSAFIPPPLQRQLCMPHSLPARELQFARQILQRLQRGADSVVFSYAQLQGDTPNLPCSLITHFPNFEPLPTHYEAQKSPKLIALEECFNIPVLPEENIYGGTAILSNQAKCPFKAFAEHRLRAKSFLQTRDGLDNKERGQIIHKVMELLWQKLESQHKLLQLSDDLLDEHIAEAIHTALASLKSQHGDITDSIQEVEYSRLKRLARTCLEWEKQRAPFTVAAIEQSYEINLASLNFQVRVDRLDQVENKKWVIDYKSTLPTSKPWNEERPKESQLLLYALLDEQINTLLLLQLKTGKISCSGFSEEKQSISGITALKKEETWAEYRDIWQKQLTDLAQEFQEGYCAPQPAHTTICQQCDFQNLCRFQVEE